MATMAIVLLILCSIIGVLGSLFFFKRNLAQIKLKNSNEASKYKRAFNYVPAGLWYGYLLVFFIGLIVNNLIFN